MPINRHAVIRYHTLDKCFKNRARSFDIYALAEACTQAIYEQDGGVNGGERKTLSGRQIRKDIAFMESENGYAIELEKYQLPDDKRRVYFRYADPEFSITKKPISDKDAVLLTETLMTLQRFKGMPQFDWIQEISTRLQKLLDLKYSQLPIISFDNNPFLKGLEWVDPLYQAILDQQTLSIHYHPFDSAPLVHIVSPYLLRQYNNRWFVLCKSDQVDYLINLALDRIMSLDYSMENYDPIPFNDPEEFFEDIIGVTKRLDEPVQEIIVEVEKTLWPYVETKPIHESQKVFKNSLSQPWVKVGYEIRTNYEFYAVLLSHGGRIRVISPQSVKEKMKSIIHAMAVHYT